MKRRNDIPKEPTSMNKVELLSINKKKQSFRPSSLSSCYKLECSFSYTSSATSMVSLSLKKTAFMTKTKSLFFR